MSTEGTILVVDDDDAIRHGTRLRLDMNGFQVTVAVDGSEALTKALDIQPDVILMDIRMPIMDGLTALRQLKSDPKTTDIPVVIASASAKDQTSSLDAGASFFLRKPYSNEALLATVKRSSNFVQP